MFDAGDTYFIALVDTADSDSDEGEPSTKTNRASAGTTATSRKVVVRDDYVHDGGEEIFLVDREFLWCVLREGCSTPLFGRNVF